MLITKGSRRNKVIFPFFRPAPCKAKQVAGWPPCFQHAWLHPPQSLHAPSECWVISHKTTKWQLKPLQHLPLLLVPRYSCSHYYHHPDGRSCNAMRYWVNERWGACFGFGGSSYFPLSTYLPVCMLCTCDVTVTWQLTFKWWINRLSRLLGSQPKAKRHDNEQSDAICCYFLFTLFGSFSSFHLRLFIFFLTLVDVVGIVLRKGGCSPLHKLLPTPVTCRSCGRREEPNRIVWHEVHQIPADTKFLHRTQKSFNTARAAVERSGRRHQQQRHELWHNCTSRWVQMEGKRWFGWCNGRLRWKEKAEGKGPFKGEAWAGGEARWEVGCGEEENEERGEEGEGEPSYH